MKKLEKNENWVFTNGILSAIMPTVPKRTWPRGAVG
jgi:hypothetical protein